MTSKRKSASVNKRFSKLNEESPEKDGGSGSRRKQRKRKLSDRLGSQWSKEEIEQFYEAYRKYGKDWKKVASSVRNRSAEMVEALYNMNRAYLSLPEGTASVVGLIAMMTDHYNIMEGSESERESNAESGVLRKPKKRSRVKFRSNVQEVLVEHGPDLSCPRSAPLNYGCLPLLKKKRSGGARPRAVGKRTPRFPVSYSYHKYDEKSESPDKQIRKAEVDVNHDEVAVLVLAEALQKGGSPQVSQTPNKQGQITKSSFIRNEELMHATEDDGLEGSLGSRESENGELARDTSYMMDTEGFGTLEIHSKGKRNRRKKSKFQDAENDNYSDVREACSGTEEGLAASSVKEKVEDEVTNRTVGQTPPHGPRKRSRQLFFGDESSALDALCALADISMKLAPASTVESESAVQFKEGNIESDIVEKSGRSGSMSAKHQRSKAKISVNNEKHQLVTGDNADRNVVRDTHLITLSQRQATAKIRKIKCKSLGSKTPHMDANSDSKLRETHKTVVPAEEGKKLTTKVKRADQNVPVQKQGKSVRPPERSSSNTNTLNIETISAASDVLISSVNQVNQSKKLRNRRKNALIRKVPQYVENIRNVHPAVHSRELNLKEKLCSSFSSQIFRQWCAFEWFYSAIDYPWFAKREFVEYLNHVGLGHVPRLTRVEWGVIRSSLGKPRRLSQQFLREEKEKLEQYRESVRTHYTELRAGIREGLPTDLAQPLSVGQRVIACHPKTRELHDGNVLTVDRNKCRVQFDRPELGVEFVMDIDCMPLNPLENIPEALRRQNFVGDKMHENFSEPKLNSHSKNSKIVEYMKVGLSENQEVTNGTPQMSSPTYQMNTLLKLAKGDTANTISQAKAAASEIANAQNATYSQSFTLAQMQAREADIRALSELNHALDKKEALVVELRHMNDDVLEEQKYGNTTLKASESFKKQYAMVLVHLKEANDQVSSALLCLRQRNTYEGTSSPPSTKPVASLGGSAGSLSSFEQETFLPQESGSHVLEILETSKLRGKAMVDAAVQAITTYKEGEDVFAKVGGALDSTDTQHLGAHSGMSTVQYSTPLDPGLGSLTNHELTSSCTLESVINSSANGLNRTNTSEQVDVQIPSELISSCVSTLAMIQACTERQYPPTEVAHILDSAVRTLQPCCLENLPIYREIQMCMGLVKNQLLALIPT